MRRLGRFVYAFALGIILPAALRAQAETPRLPDLAPRGPDQSGTWLSSVRLTGVSDFASLPPPLMV